jgi:sugar lactone lactonase YvrE
VLKVILSLVVIVSFILLAGTMQEAFSAIGSHPFILKWGGSGLTEPGFFSLPQKAAVDSEGNIYVTDLGNKRIQKFDNDGVFVAAWGNSNENVEFSEPTGIAVYDDLVFVIDSKLGTVQKFDSIGTLITKWGGVGNEKGQFSKPNGIAVSKDGIVYVADTENHRVQKFTLDGKFISEFYPGDSKYSKDLPVDIAIDKDGNIYVSDPYLNKISKYDSDENFIKKLGPNVGGYPMTPYGITTDLQGNVYAADGSRDRILYLDKEGATITIFGSTGIGNGQFKVPLDVAMDPQGHLFVVDSNGHRIQKFDTPTTTKIVEPLVEETQPVQETQPLTTVNPVPNDFTKPLIIAPNDMLVEAAGGLTPISIGKATASDESGIQSLISNAPAQFPIGATTIIWTAIDGAGNVGIATQTITVVDTVPPVLSSLPDLVVESSNSKQTVELTMPEVKDTVGVLSLTNDAPEVFPLGDTVVTWTATDVVKNSAITTQKVTVVDTIPPTITAPKDVVVEATSFNENVVELGEATVVDNGKILSITNDAPISFSIGDTTITWMASDEAGNIATATQKISVIDTTIPQIISPENIIFEATSIDENVVKLVAPTVIDVQPVIIANDAPLVFPLGDTVVTWMATDSSGNLVTATQTVTVVDTTAPKITAPNDVTVEAIGLENNVVNLGDLSVEDITGVAAITHNAPEHFPLGTTIVTWTVTDNYGNIITADQKVTVVDTTSPTMDAPKDLIVEASSLEENFVELGEPKVKDIIGIESITNDAPAVFPLGMTTVTWTVTDTSGNTASDTQIVTIHDTTPPALSIPENITIEAIGPSGMSVNIGEATATDVIKVDSITNNAPETFYLGETTVIWTAIDSFGNMVTANQTISVIDTTVPSITPPADITIEAQNPTSNVVSLGIATAEDIVGVALIEVDAPSVFSLGETIVTWVATDSSGNSATATQKILIIDTTPPVLTQPSSLQVEATSEFETQVSLGNATASDHIQVASVTNDAPSVFPLGDTVVTWTATDSSGNSVNATQTVTVVDTTAPTIETLPLITIEATNKNQNYVELGTIVATDLVGITSITNDAPQVFPFGLTTITWTVQDKAGNNVNATQQVSVIDTTAPSVVAPDNLVIEAVSSNNNIIDLGNAIATDEVEVSSITNDAPSVFTLGETIVTWVATDSSGNLVTATQTITVVDTTAPTIETPSIITVEATSLDANPVLLVTPKAQDSVSNVIITNDAPDVFPFGETIVTWQATDEAGNFVTTTQNVSVIDTTSPILTVPADITVDAMSIATPISIGEASATDVTDSLPVITNDAPFAFILGENIVTWTSIDKLGNSVSMTQKVTVQACGKPHSYYNMIFGTEEDDMVTGTNLSDLVFALGGDDIIFGEKGNDCILGGEGDDIIYGNEGNDNISSGEGTDIIKGLSGDDILNGGSGIDVIDGGDDVDSCNVNDQSKEDLIVKCES